MIGIVNYGSGNIRAIANIYEQLHIEYKVINKLTDFTDQISKIILPGVGAFDETMKHLNESGFRDLLDEKALIDKVPVLGICVGMQILAEGSEEGNLPGLGWVKGYVKKFDESKLTFLPKLPHLGWNSVKPTREAKILEDIDFETGFYFIHSYFFQCTHTSDVLTTTDYGDAFSSSINYENIFGTQFHPEKSHKNGIRLLNNFGSL